MYGVPDDLDLVPFAGATLTQICIGAHEVQFHFTGSQPGETAPSINVESTWTLYDSTGAVVDRASREDQLPSDREAYRLHVLLSRKVTSTTVAPPRSVALVFGGGYTLRIFDDNADGESFQIHPGNIIV